MLYLVFNIGAWERENQNSLPGQNLERRGYTPVARLAGWPCDQCTGVSITHSALVYIMDGVLHLPRTGAMVRSIFVDLLLDGNGRYHCG